jgi:hypothetical protein
MNPILAALLIALSAIAAGTILCALLGAVWFAIQPTHEADEYGVPPLGGIPADREFTDPDTNPVNRVNPVRSNSALWASSATDAPTDEM